LFGGFLGKYIRIDVLLFAEQKVVIKKDFYFHLLITILLDSKVYHNTMLWDSKVYKLLLSI